MRVERVVERVEKPVWCVEYRDRVVEVIPPPPDPTQAAAIRETAIVFGGKDANGYATRISVLVGASSTGAGPTGTALPGGLTVPPVVVPATGGTSDSDLWNFLYRSGA